MKDLRQKLKVFFENNWPFFLITFLVFVFFWKVFIKGLIPLPADFTVGVYYPWLDYKWDFPTGVPVKNPILTDVVSFTYPMQILAIDLLKSGKLPLWNPYILAGTPLLANFQSAPFSPTNVVYFFFDKLSAWSIQIILQHVLAGIFTYLLLRSWKVSKLGSVLSGIVFAFSGFNLIWSQWNGHALSASFIPLVLLFEDLFFEEGKIRFALGVCLTIFLQTLSGYPQVILYTALAMGILWLLKIKGNKNSLKKTIVLVIFILFSFGLSAFQIIPGKELLGLSQRSVEPHPFEWAFLPLKKIITFVAADFYGNHATKNYWGPQDYTSNTGFVGIVAFSLALLSLALVRKNKQVFYSFILVITSLVLAFPTPVSIGLWKSGFLGFNAASAHRSLVLFNLGIAALSGFGYDYLRYKVKFKSKLVSLLIPFLIIVGFAIYAYFIRQKTIFGQSVFLIAMRNLIIPGGILAATTFIILFARKLKIFLILFSIIELFYFGWKFTPFTSRQIVFPTTPVLDFLINQEKSFRVTGDRVIPINMKMPYKLESLEGYDALYPLRISQFLAAMNGGKSGTDPLGRYGTVDDDTSRLLDLINTKYYLVHNLDNQGNPSPVGEIPGRFQSDRFKEAFRDKSVTVLKSKTALPRSFFVGKWEVVKNNEEILDKMLNPDFDFAKKIILEEDPPLGTRGFVFTSDSWYPGWMAKVNGRQEKIYRADFAFRAVPVASSNSKVEYMYHPDSFYLGVKISLFSLVFLILTLYFLK